MTDLVASEASELLELPHKLLHLVFREGMLHLGGLVRREGGREGEGGKDGNTCREGRECGRGEASAYETAIVTRRASTQEDSLTLLLVATLTCWQDSLTCTGLQLLRNKHFRTSHRSQ